MNSMTERRRERRLYFDWPVWFSTGHGSILFHRRMIEVTSKSMAFSCSADEDYPPCGQKIKAQFSVPIKDSEGRVGSRCVIQEGYVIRVDEQPNRSHRVVVEFSTPLPFEPAKEVKIEEGAKVEPAVK